ncbi:CDP-alcohol phosphatidyltransferase family protein [Chondromyces apiculatus]|uniref:CDP-diacylglycerol--serine O-phosphatidyltransferase n=1 Tax=Chondromyces apiculatus DSM 436 TaxID=1192034 RepID=A0A017TG40_9BACT|nr:CDP-alcohol phosphatidyltransferase family protein [Chondromyces apiculatus]EYF07795.1 CDP-diacylglycerol--serine O-phosphatidyltransferase [Chondromyces apiculatus DSM 436]
MSTASERPRRFSMLRSFVLADLITLGNAASGTLSLFFCLNYLDTHERTYIWFALVLLPVALFCDVMDGTVARWRRKHSPLGADLDSLADVISFGVAPAVLGYTLGLRGALDMVALVFFVCCGISRLARYNVTASQLSDESGKVKYYQGTPIPSSLILVLILGVLFSTGRVHENLWLGAWQLGPAVLHPLSLLFVLSGNAMISATLRIPKP